ncbi:VCBS repeat-containing protein [Streptomyces sp. F001]|uniref:FG-GAP repeat domain-containing protein n=1 Tax=Streptomyces sp. F001 TaxID=1510026 RepID=UPI00101E4BA5|nr:VCBS repeat-containing protein [Streptomyces sp. F001]
MKRARRTAVVGTVTVVAAALIGPSAPAGSSTAPRVHAVDFDADGYEDVVIPQEFGTVDGERSAGYVGVVYGSATARKPRTQVISRNSPGVPGRAEPDGSFGWDTTPGDLDRDGYTDLVVSGGPGPTVLWGGPRGLSGGTAIDVGGGRMVTGDFDGDGHLDLASQETVAHGPITRRGGAARTTEITLKTREHPVDEDELEVWETFDLAAGDVNGDGIDDLLATAWVDYDGEMVGTPFLLYLRGTPDGLAEPKTVKKTAGKDLRAGQELATGDLDGDGIDDVLFGDVYDVDGGHVGVVPGSASGPDGGDATVIRPRAPRGGEDMDFGFALALGDADGDGDLDAAIGSPRAQMDKRTLQGRVVVLKQDRSGGLTGKDAQAFDRAACDLPAEGSDVHRFASGARLADLNGDGRAELLTSWIFGNRIRGYCVLPGTSGGPAGAAPYFIAAPKR